jgi:hypothetical protein
MNKPAFIAENKVKLTARQKLKHGEAAFNRLRIKYFYLNTAKR